MTIIQENDQYLSRLFQMIQQSENKYTYFHNDFNYYMAKTAIETLQNMNLMLNEYDHATNETTGQHILSLFGILQGLFVAIDSLYSIGRATSLHKIMINLNQNDILREIKIIRNDVVGHPSYRQYEEDSVGFCVLDLDHLTNHTIRYLVYTKENKSVVIDHKSIEMNQVILNYYQESNQILQQTIQFLSFYDFRQTTELSDDISMLGYRYHHNEKDARLLQSIKDKFISQMKLSPKSNHRVLWRIQLIEKLFNYHDQNSFIVYLCHLEIYKLYMLIYQMEKQLHPKLKYKFISVKQPEAFAQLKLKMKQIHSHHFDANVLQDSRHPLYRQHMDRVLAVGRYDKNTTTLVDWIHEKVLENDKDILYLIGSELKK